MQFYPLVGSWTRHGAAATPWRAWSVSQTDSNGVTDVVTGVFRIQAGRLSMHAADSAGHLQPQPLAIGALSGSDLREFRALPQGTVGLNPDQPQWGVDLWGEGIHKLTALTVINQGLFEQLFG